MTAHRAIIEVDVAPEFAPLVDSRALEAAVRQALATVSQSGHKGLPLEGRSAHVSVRVNGDAEMQELNRTYRGVDRPTDVLSFAFTESELPTLPPEIPLQLGDVALDVEYAQRQATELHHSLDMELSWLAIHGTLQLLGFHHATDEEAAHMEELETAALRALGFRKGLSG